MTPEIPVNVALIYVQQPLVAAFRINIHGQSSSGSQSKPQESASAKVFRLKLRCSPFGFRGKLSRSQVDSSSNKAWYEDHQIREESTGPQPMGPSPNLHSPILSVSQLYSWTWKSNPKTKKNLPSSHTGSLGKKPEGVSELSSFGS